MNHKKWPTNNVSLPITELPGCICQEFCIGVVVYICTGLSEQGLGRGLRISTASVEIGKSG